MAKKQHSAGKSQTDTQQNTTNRIKMYLGREPSVADRSTPWLTMWRLPETGSSFPEWADWFGVNLMPRSHVFPYINLKLASGLQPVPPTTHLRPEPLYECMVQLVSSRLQTENISTPAWSLMEKTLTPRSSTIIKTTISKAKIKKVILIILK